MYRTRIYYQDTDAGGVVYYANYLRFFEKSWFEYLMSVGISLPEWETEGVYVMVRSASLDLLDKTRYGDIIEVNTSVQEVKNAYFVLRHTITRSGIIVTKGETKMVCVDGTGKPRRIPGTFRDILIKGIAAP